jgi:hypothetical protein
MPNAITRGRGTFCSFLVHLYYFEAVDEDGNGAHYPDFLKETPYFVIESWEM